MLQSAASEWRVRFEAAAGSAARCCLRVLLSQWGVKPACQCLVRFFAGMLVPMQGAAARCCLRVLLEGDVLLSERWVRLRVGMLLEVTCALWSWCPAVQSAA